METHLSGESRESNQFSTPEVSIFNNISFNRRDVLIWGAIGGAAVVGGILSSIPGVNAFVGLSGDSTQAGNSSSAKNHDRTAGPAPR